MAMTTPGNSEDRGTTRPSGAPPRPQPKGPSNKASKRAAEEQARAAARRQRLILGGIGLAFIAIFAAIVVLWPKSEPVAKKSAVEPEGTETFRGLDSSHVTGKVEYPNVPPPGGNHNPVWWNCGAYNEPVPVEQAVHSMEHGAVWIAYGDIPDDQVTALQSLTGPGRFVLVAPWDEARGALPSPIVLTAWGKQLKVDTPADPRVGEFISAFESGPQTLEVGAACSGADGTPIA